MKGNQALRSIGATVKPLTLSFRQSRAPFLFQICCRRPRHLSDLSPQLSLAAVLPRRNSPSLQLPRRSSPSPQFSLAAVLPNFKTLDRGRRMTSLNENVIGVDSANPPELSSVAPYVGMEFATVEEAKNYYDEYGKRHEFCTLQRDIKRGIARSDQITSVKFVCQRHEKQSESEQTYATEKESYTVAIEADAGGVKGKRGKARTSSSVGVGCKAAMQVAFDRFRGRYVMYVFNDKAASGSKKIVGVFYKANEAAAHSRDWLRPH